MKKSYTTLQNTLLLIVLLLLGSQVWASHLLGADISASRTSANTYAVRLVLYRDCSGISTTSSVSISVSSTGCSATTIQASRVSSQFLNLGCSTMPTTCNGGTLPGVEMVVYSGIYQATPNCGVISFAFSECCRSSVITNLVNPSTNSIYVSCSVNSAISNNNTPNLPAMATLGYCNTGTQSIVNTATDVDGDSLVYTLVNPQNALNTSIPFVTPYTAANPFGSPSIGFSNGVLTTNVPMGTYNYALRIDELRNGAVISTTYRDMSVFGDQRYCQGGPTNVFPPMVTVTSNPPANPNGVISACMNSPVVFTVNVNDPDLSTQQLIYTINPLGITGMVPNNGTFTFTAIAGNVTTLLIDVSDMDPCNPLNSFQQIYIMPNGFNTTTTSTPPSTCGANDGMSLVVASGGVVPYNYLWSNGATSSTVSGLAPGYYTVTVVDATGCMAVDSASIWTNQGFGVNFQTTPEDCTQSNGTAVALVGPTGNYTYLWSNGGTTANIQNLIEGFYYITITDAITGCSLTESVYIPRSNTNNPPPVITTTVSHPVMTANMVGACPGDVVTFTTHATLLGPSVGQLDYIVYPLNISGSIPSGGSFTFNVTAGQVSTIQIVVSESFGCSATPATETWIVQPITPQVSLTASPWQFNCGVGGTVQLFAQMPTNATINWSPANLLNNPNTPSPLATVTQTTTFTATVTSGNCTSVESITVTVNPTGNYLGIQPSSPSVCAGNPVTLNVTDTNPNGGASSNYTVSQIPFTGMITGGTAVILSDDELTPAIPLPFSFNYYNQSYQNIYISSNGFVTFNPTSPNGCCSGGVIPTAGGVENFIALVWSDLNPSNGGSISYQTLGTAPCREFVVSYNQIPEFSSQTTSVTGYIKLKECGNIIEVSTTNSNITRVATQGIENFNGSSGLAVPGRNGSVWSASQSAYRFAPQGNYLWSNGQSGSSIVVNPTTPTNYWVVNTSNQCPDTAFYTVNVSPAMIAFTTATHAGCNAMNGAIDLTVTGGTQPYTFIWSNQANTEDIAGLSPGFYFVEIIDANGCVFSLGDTVLGPFNYYFQSSPSNCGGATGAAWVSAFSNGSNSFTYEWNTGATGPTVGNLAAGWYSVTITDVTTGCRLHQNIEVGQLPNCFATISGYVYSDTAQTCNPANLLGLPNVLVSLSNGMFTYTDQNGYYEFTVLATQAYTITPMPYSGINIHCPSSGTINVSVTGFGNSYNGNNFFIDAVELRDVGVSATTYMGTTPGRTFAPHITVCNHSQTTQANTVLVYTYDSALNFNASNSYNTAGFAHDATNHTLTWTIPTLAPNQCRVFRAHFTLSTTTLLGDTVCNQVNVGPLTNDVNVSNNQYNWCNLVTSSWDPNDKSVYPHHLGNQNDGGYVWYATEKTLQYTIRFQNTGTDTAYTVVLRDLLDVNKLDLQSLQVLGASHSYRMTVEGNNELVVWFEDINLPDSFVNEPMSSGYFAFTINLKNGLSIGSEVLNTAGIYFDFNAPVITNTTRSVLGTPLSVQTPGSAVGIALQPNPSSHSTSLVLSLEGESRETFVNIVDVSGKTVMQVANNVWMPAGESIIPINIESLSAGMYFVNVQTTYGSTTAKLTVIR